MTSISDLRGGGGFNQITTDKIGDINPSYNDSDIYDEIENERDQAELDQMMHIIQDGDGNGNGNGDEDSYADNILKKSDKFKIFSSVFMDLKDPLIMLLISQVFSSKFGRKFYKDRAPFVHDPETGAMSYAGMALRFGIILIVFYVTRRLLNSNFKM